MSHYRAMLRVRRFYSLNGNPIHEDRRLGRRYYQYLTIVVGERENNAVVSLGQHILIEGTDDDSPFVAQLLKLFWDVNSNQMKAVVHWFVRMHEIAQNKRKLLGRDPHPQEVFYYQDGSCDCEVNVETILGAVQVKHIPAADPFPDNESEDTLFVKLIWDTKTFRKMPPPVPKSPSPSVPVTRARALPTPDPTVMKRAMAGLHPHSCMSTGKIGTAEAESAHSASKLSAAKILNVKRRSRVSSNPNIRKKLELCSPAKHLTRDDVLDEILDEDKDTQEDLVTKLGSFPIHSVSVSSSRLTPLSTPEKPYTKEGKFSLRPMNKPSETTVDNHDSGRREEQHEISPGHSVHTDSSKRRSARIKKKQLSQLNNHNDLQSDGEDADDDGSFVPADLDRGSSSDEEEESLMDSEDELIVKRSRRGTGRRTPHSTVKSRASARTPRRMPSKKAAPPTPQTPRHATPSIPNRSQPARKPGNMLEEARARLHVSSVPESLPCREQEFQDIYNFVESKVMDGTGGCMYISGVPGTGKTATVHEVIRSLQQAVEQEELPPFHFIEINGMKMTDPHQAYVQILQKLTNQKATADHAAALLEKRFSTPAPKKETTVLLVDELDLLWTRKQNVMYNLFDWPARKHARLVVLTIANTMDLPERIMINRVASRLGLTRMSFQPYTFKQLQQIITSRLNRVKAFEEDALQLVSRKVAALSGDARRCLDICRRATEICEQHGQQGSTGLVGMSHVMEALDEMFSSSYITAIRCASLQEQLFLRAVIAEFRRLGLEEATFQQVLVQHQALCRVEGLQPVSVSESLAVCQRLGACRLLLLEPSRLDLLLRVRLNVSQDDVLYALKAE
ncbi:origin recognition complex subunit 1 isoform X2 [Electrophorus electricus]|uniref:origin recognition complex subunit 1 isoform X2 n=1 Tax=Electrophorus electricus TaxID=8005 RepID=UPI0015D07912|nr:origin recognition complex subunit 1 isoform X2 [Electrophorus electricus]